MPRCPLPSPVFTTNVNNIAFSTSLRRTVKRADNLSLQSATAGPLASREKAQGGGPRFEREGQQLPQPARRLPLPSSSSRLLFEGTQPPITHNRSRNRSDEDG